MNETSTATPWTWVGVQVSERGNGRPQHNSKCAPRLCDRSDCSSTCKQPANVRVVGTDRQTDRHTDMSTTGRSTFLRHSQRANAPQESFSLHTFHETFIDSISSKIYVLYSSQRQKVNRKEINTVQKLYTIHSLSFCNFSHIMIICDRLLESC